MDKIQMTNKDIELLHQAVEFDLIRYGDGIDNERYKSLLELHMNKYQFFINRGQFNTQKELTDSLIKYKNTFKSFSTKGNLFY